MTGVMHRFALLSIACIVITLLACNNGQTFPQRPAADVHDASAPVDTPSRTVDFALPPPGVPDRGRATGLVLIEVGVAVRCSAALIASNVALAPARCLARRGCGALPPEALSVRSSDENEDVLGPVVELVGPPGDDYCDDNALAAVVLAAHVEGLAPFAIRARPAAVGEFVRYVGVGATRDAGASPSRLLRDHQRVETSSRRTLGFAGDSCATLNGAIALDEATGELVGVGVAPRGPCEAEAVSFGQVDAARLLLATALERAAAPRIDEDGGLLEAGAPRRGKATRPTLDLGEPCETAAECAAGVCVLDQGGAGGYCSRTCGPGDRCPIGLRCEHGVDAERVRSACVRSS